MNAALRWIAAALGALRYTALLAVVSCAAGAVLMFVAGAKKTWVALAAFATGRPPAGADAELDLTAAVITSLFAALDSALFGLVLLYAACGVFSLFVDGRPSGPAGRFPPQLAPASLAELKQQVAVVVVILLIVLFLELVWSSLGALHSGTWELLVVPVSILLVAASLWLLGRSHP